MPSRGTLTITGGREFINQLTYTNSQRSEKSVIVTSDPRSSAKSECDEGFNICKHFVQPVSVGLCLSNNTQHKLGIGSGTLAYHAGASIRCPTSDFAGRTLISMS